MSGSAKTKNRPWWCAGNALTDQRWSTPARPPCVRKNLFALWWTEPLHKELPLEKKWGPTERSQKCVELSNSSFSNDGEVFVVTRQTGTLSLDQQVTVQVERGYFIRFQSGYRSRVQCAAPWSVHRGYRWSPPPRDKSLLPTVSTCGVRQSDNKHLRWGQHSSLAWRKIRSANL